MPQLSNIERSISSALHNLAKEILQDLKPEHGNWTQHVKDKIISLATKHGCTPCGSGCKHPEFLCDVVWLKGDPIQGITDAALVLESEWGNDQCILYDFAKLLIARADHRVLIFTKKNHDQTRKLVERLKKQISQFVKSEPGDRYLFIAWEDDVNDFVPELYVVGQE